MKEPQETTVIHCKLRISAILKKFARKNSDSLRILNQCGNLTFDEIANLLESSLSMQQQEIEQLKKKVKSINRRIEELSQGALL